MLNSPTSTQNPADTSIDMNEPSSITSGEMVVPKTDVGVIIPDQVEGKMSSFSSRSDLKIQDTIEDGVIQAFGYAPVYRRVFATFRNLCMVIALTSPVSAIVVTANYQVNYGGYFGLSWGWVIPNIIYMPPVLAVAELASSMPVNGAFYWWSGALASPKYTKIISFVAGWFNIFQMFTATAAFVYAVASITSFAVTIGQPDFAFTNAQMMALSIAVLLVWTLIMCCKLETISAIFIATSAIVLIQTLVLIFALPIMHKVQGQQFASGAQVFGSYQNFSDWGKGVAIPYTWFAALWVNSAWMCPVYVSEETHNASVEIPKSVITTYSVTAIVGFIVCLLSAFCITDMETLNLNSDGYPLVTVIVDHWGQIPSTIFFAISAAIVWFGGSGTLVTYASQLAAFARDGGLPFNSKFAYVHPRLNQPIYSVGLLIVGTCLILLFSLSEEASSIIYSLSVTSGLIMFELPMITRVFVGDRWIPGPFTLGKWSIPCHVTAIFVQTYFVIMEAFPASSHPTPSTANYNAALSVATFLISLGLYWVIGSRYQGPHEEALARWRSGARGQDQERGSDLI